MGYYSHICVAMNTKTSPHIRFVSSRVLFVLSRPSHHEQRKVTRAERKKEARAVSSLRAPPVDACHADTAATWRSGRCANSVCIDSTKIA